MYKLFIGEKRASNITLTHFKIYYQHYINNEKKKHGTAKDRHVDQQKRIESSERNPHTYIWTSDLRKGANTQKGKGSLSVNKWCWEN